LDSFQTAVCAGVQKLAAEYRAVIAVIILDLRISRLTKDCNARSISSAYRFDISDLVDKLFAVCNAKKNKDEPCPQFDCLESLVDEF